MKKSKKKVTLPKAALIEILNTLSARVESLSNRAALIGNESAQTTDKVSAFLGRERFIHAKVQDAYSAAKGQDEINRETTKSLYNLRESTRTAFDNVTADVKNILQTAKRAAERIEQVENQNVSLLSTIKILEGRVKAAEDKTAQLTALSGQRMKAIEARAKYCEEKLAAVHATASALFVYPEIKGSDSRGEFIYIHPLDMAELLENVATTEVVTYRADGTNNLSTVTIGKTRYMQTPYVPRRPGKNKIV